MIRRRPRLRLSIALAGVAVLAIGSPYGHWVLIENRFRTITAGKVYQSGEFEQGALVDKVRQLGVRTVIDLRQEGPEVVDAERAALQGEGVQYTNLPSGQVPRDGTVDSFLEIMERQDTYPVLIHCEHGQGRSVLFAALYRIEFEGWSNERACRATRLLPGRGSFEPDTPKGTYLRAYEPRRRAVEGQAPEAYSHGAPVSTGADSR